MSDEFQKSQFACPEGGDGRKVLEHMNDHHQPLWADAMAKMPKSVDGAVLDIGCGGGGFLKRMSERYPWAMLFGVDISEESLRMTSEVNSDLMDAGGLELRKASVDGLPFEDGSFDIVTAMETYFFWSDLEAGLREISRVASAGAVIIIASEVRNTPDNQDDIARMKDQYGARIVPDQEMLRLMDCAGMDAEAFPTDSGAVYRGIKRI